MKLVLALAAVLLASPALAQQPVQTWPAPASIATNASNRIATTFTFQKIFDAVGSVSTQQRRSGCVIQNLVTSTIVRPMWIFFGTATATTAKSLRLDAGDTFACNIGGVTIQDKINITGFAGDEFFAIQQ